MSSKLSYDDLCLVIHGAYDHDCTESNACGKIAFAVETALIAHREAALAAPVTEDAWAGWQAWLVEQEQCDCDDDRLATFVSEENHRSWHCWQAAALRGREVSDG